jgi:farnesyl diphosphate synthase
MHFCGIPSPHSYASLVASGQSNLTSQASLLPKIAQLSSSFTKPEATLSPGQPSKDGTKDPYAQALEILIPLGEYFQVQDDYLDGFGTPEQIGKVGTDIVDNKCGWLVCTALAIATPEQREVLQKNYGVRPTEAELAAGAGQKGKGLGAAEARVKELYNEMKLEQLYMEYQERVVTELRARIEQVDEIPGEPGMISLKKEVFTTFLEKIYGRTK